MRRILTNTTALVACLSLSLPAPVLGQETEAEEPELCADGTALPCEPVEDGTMEEAVEEGTLPPCEPVEDGAAEAAPAEGVDAEGETADSTVDTENAAEPVAEGEVLLEGECADAAADEVDASPAPDDSVEVEQPVESEADVSVDPALSEDGEATGGAEGEAEAGADATVEPDASAEPEADASEAPEVIEGQSDDTTTSDATVEESVDSEAEAGVEPEEGAADGELPVADESTATEEAGAEESTTTEEADAEATATEEESATAEAEAAEDAAEAAMSAEAASADADADADAEVTEETVTEETARSSDENFATRIMDVFEGSGDDADRDVLIGTVLGGLGGFAASQILNNRQVVVSSEDRVVVQRADGTYQLLKDDNALLRQPGSQVRTQTFSDGSTRTVVTRPDGSQVVTIRDAELRVVHRTRITPDGQEIVLINDTGGSQAVDVSTLPQPSAADADVTSNEEALRRALRSAQRSERSYSLSQIREVRAVRALAPAIQLDNVTFETGSAAITSDQAEQLNELGQLIAGMIEENPREIFLVEGHTDAVGDAAYNLALSDRRAESVALALTEYFEVPPENLVVQGYGERYLRVDTEGPERLNRRASVRRITELLQVASAE